WRNLNRHFRPKRNSIRLRPWRLPKRSLEEIQSWHPTFAPAKARKPQRESRNSIRQNWQKRSRKQRAILTADVCKNWPHRSRFQRSSCWKTHSVPQVQKPDAVSLPFCKASRADCRFRIMKEKKEPVA